MDVTVFRDKTWLRWAHIAVCRNIAISGFSIYQPWFSNRPSIRLSMSVSNAP